MFRLVEKCTYFLDNNDSVRNLKRKSDKKWSLIAKTVPKILLTKLIDFSNSHIVHIVQNSP